MLPGISNSRPCAILDGGCVLVQAYQSATKRRRCPPDALRRDDRALGQTCSVLVTRAASGVSTATG